MCVFTHISFVRTACRPSWKLDSVTYRLESLSPCYDNERAGGGGLARVPKQVFRGFS